MPLTSLVLRHAVGEHDVEREQHRVGERQGHPERLAGELDVGEQVHAGHRDQQGGEVAPACARPRAASTITGRNSIAATVPSGSRSMAR